MSYLRRYASRDAISQSPLSVISLLNIVYEYFGIKSYFLKYMKILVRIFLVLITNNCCFSQDFGTPDVKWVYDHKLNGITEILFEKDTLIDGQIFNKFSKQIIRIDGGDTLKVGLKPIFLRENNGIVQYTEDLIYIDTLYHFNAEIGTVWTIFEDNLKNDSITFEILDVFETTINNSIISSQSVLIKRYIGNNIRTFTDTVFASIGSKYSYILPFDIEKSNPEGGVLRCFENNYLGVVNLNNAFLFDQYLYSNFAYDCETTVSILSINKKIESIYPNPTKDGLVFFTGDFEKYSKYKIFDVTGQLVLESKIANENYMDLRGLLNGVYFISIEGNNNIFRITIAN